MGFFKKLKERLFTLNIEEPKKRKIHDDKKIGSKKTKLQKSQIKLDKKLEKQKKIIRQKENKINKYVAGLSKSNSTFSRQIKEIQNKYNKIDEVFFENLEEILIMSDISTSLVMDIIDEIKKEVKIENVIDPKLISEIIVDKMFAIYANQSIVDTTLNIKEGRVNVIIMSGVNGSGKTTTIAKISNKYIKENKKVLIAAADTFRAGAIEQLDIWAKRVGADIVKPIKQNADPASVVFDATQKAKNENYDLLIVDTAGRLQNKVNLMNEFAKISKIIQREIDDAPHESLLVLDATTGQNGISQATKFKEVAPITGIVLTKMDGTSKGGIVLTIKDKLQLVVKMIGLGEQLDDLQEFDLDAFIYGITKGLMNDSIKG